MLVSTSYHPAVPRLVRTADPWPRWQDVMADLQEDFNYWISRPRRPFPAAEYCANKVNGAAFCLLPVVEPQPPTFDVQAWQEAFFHPAPIPPALYRDYARITAPLTRKQKLARWLDQHRGALAIWRKKPTPEPLRCEQCEQPIDGPAWEANEHSKLLCGTCWLEQESWAR